VAELAQPGAVVDVDQHPPGTPPDQGGDQQPEGDVAGAATASVDLQGVLGQPERARHLVQGLTDRAGAAGHDAGDRRAAQHVQHQAARHLGRGGVAGAEPLGPRGQRPPEQHVHPDDHDDHDADRQEEPA
jgi:hypothetical protein